MGNFEVTLTFPVKAEDRIDAARQAYLLIDAQTPTSFWVCNEGGVGDEVRVEGARLSIAKDMAQDSVHELVDDLYRLGVTYGAGKSGDEHEHNRLVEDIKRRLLTAAAKAQERDRSRG